MERAGGHETKGRIPVSRCAPGKKGGPRRHLFEQGHSQANFLNFFFLKHLF